MYDHYTAHDVAAHEAAIVASLEHSFSRWLRRNFGQRVQLLTPPPLDLTIEEAEKILNIKLLRPDPDAVELYKIASHGE